mmetsp:Transcript_109216/g.189275  ORF Transcript_109216/g.189275 Transcript_109216/m.189275 type:complete len:373 (-) Transcript_109216:368-1486(-)
MGRQLASIALSGACRKPVPTAVAITSLLTSTVLFFLAVFYWRGNPKVDRARADKLEQYCFAISKWNDTARSLFEGAYKTGVYSRIDFDLQENTAVVNELGGMQLEPSEGRIQLDDPEAEYSLPTYHGLYYSYDGPITLMVKPYRDLGASIAFAFGGQTLSLPVEISRTQDHGAIGWKMCDYQKHGAYVSLPEHPGGTCLVFQKVQRLCVRVLYDTRQQLWVLKNNSTSCVVDQVNTYAADYGFVPVQRHQGPEALNISHIHIELRSADDPDLVAHDLTNGTMNFGITVSQQWQAAVAFGVSGLLCAVTGSVLFFCCIKECGYYAEVIPAKKAKTRNADTSTILEGYEFPLATPDNETLSEPVEEEHEECRYP